MSATLGEQTYLPDILNCATGQLQVPDNVQLQTLLKKEASFVNMRRKDESQIPSFTTAPAVEQIVQKGGKRRFLVDNIHF